jgi:hypothetical protein
MAKKRKYVSAKDWNKAYSLGVKSWKNEKITAPSQDKKLVDFIYSKPSRYKIGNKESIELMRAWNDARDDERAKERGKYRRGFYVNPYPNSIIGRMQKDVEDLFDFIDETFKK